MNTYLKTLMLMMAVCQILLMMSSDFLGDHTKKSVRFLCGIVMLLTLFSPLKGFMANLSGMLTNIPEEITGGMELPASEIRSQAVTESIYSYVAGEWMAYIKENYDVAEEQICILLETDENHTLVSAEILLRNCPYVIRRNIENDIAEKTEIPVVVKGE